MAFVTSWTTDFYQKESQTSRKIWLDETKEYYYRAYLSDGGGGYGFKLGLFGRKTKHTASSYKRAKDEVQVVTCLLYTSPSPRDGLLSRMPSSA